MTSTLRAPLQRFAVQTLAQQLRELRANAEDGAIVVGTTPAARCWRGLSGLSGNAQLPWPRSMRCWQQRQPGLTLKPFLYAQAPPSAA